MPGFTRLAGAAGGTCGTTLTPVAGTCTINVVFQPTGPGLVNGTLTITGNVPVTNSPVNLSGTGVPPAVSITPNPLNINLAHNVNTSTGTVTFKNILPVGGASITISRVTVSGGQFFDYFFSAVNGQDTCTGKILAPGGTCTVGVRFTNRFAPRGVNRAGTIQFTDNAVGSPQSGQLVGFATP
jgi:hypothetical protein